MFKKFLAIIFYLLFVTEGVYAQKQITVDVHATKILYDAKRDKIIGAINSSDVNYGNSLVQLNPYTGIIEKKVFIGSEPTCMAFTKDTDYVYVGLDGASFVKRVNLSTFQVDQTIALGTGPSGPRFAEDVATINLTPDLVVVALMKKTVSPHHDGVAAYFKGNKLPDETPGHTGSNVIESADDTNLVFGYNNSSTEAGFRRMSIDTMNGVTLIDLNKNMWLGNDFEYHDRFLYSDRGKILDPFAASPAFVGTYSSISFTAFSVVEPDVEHNKTFFSTLEGGLKIKRFNLITQSFIDEVIIENAYPPAFKPAKVADLIRFGEYGLAIVINESYFNFKKSKVILYESCLVQESSDIMIQTALTDSIIRHKDTTFLSVTLTNTGEINATSLVVTDTLDTSFQIVSSTATSGDLQISADNILIWEIDTVKPGQKDSILIEIYFADKGIFSNNIYSKLNELDCDYTNNVRKDTIEVIFSLSAPDVKNLESINVFPNPSYNKFSIHLYLAEYSESIRVSVTDITGRTMMEKSVNANVGYNSLDVDVSDWSSGFYLVHVKMKNGSVSKKIVKM